MEKNLTIVSLTPEATSVLTALAHPCGTYEYYTDTLGRLYSYILSASDEIGMDDTEAIHTLRVLEALRKDLSDLRDGFRDANDMTARTPAESVAETFHDFESMDPASDPKHNDSPD